MATSEEKRVVREAIWKLIYRKQECWQHLLGSAGVPWAIVEPYFRKTKPLINPTTNKPFTKYEASPFIIAAIEELPDGQEILRRLVRQIAEFRRFELSQDELQARAVVEKAKALLPAMETRLAEEERVAEALAKKIEAQQLARQAEQEKERRNAISLRRQLLLAEYDDMQKWEDHQKRGPRLEYLLQSLFELDDIPARKPFLRNQNREQIDGGFEWKGNYILVQVKWQEQLTDDHEIEYARSQRRRSGADAVLFLSVNGWTSSVIPLLEQNPEKDTFLMNGYELRCVLAGNVGMQTVIQKKLDGLKFDFLPFIQVTSES